MVRPVKREEIPSISPLDEAFEGVGVVERVALPGTGKAGMTTRRGGDLLDEARREDIFRGCIFAVLERFESVIVQKSAFELVECNTYL